MKNYIKSIDGGEIKTTDFCGFEDFVKSQATKHAGFQQDYHSEEGVAVYNIFDLQDPIEYDGELYHAISFESNRGEVYLQQYFDEAVYNAKEYEYKCDPLFVGPKI